MANKIYAQTYLCYSESMHNNFFAILEEYKLPFCYILHDKDVDKNGNLKKEHYHVLFERKLTDNETEIVYKYGGISYKEDVRSCKGIKEYLTHENQKDKYHYSFDDVKYSKDWNADKWDDILNKESEKQVACSEIFSVIMENDIHTYSELVKFAMSNLTDKHVDLVVKRAYAFKEFMRG